MALFFVAQPESSGLPCQRCELLRARHLRPGIWPTCQGRDFRENRAPNVQRERLEVKNTLFVPQEERRSLGGAETAGTSNFRIKRTAQTSQCKIKSQCQCEVKSIFKISTMGAMPFRSSAPLCLNQSTLSHSVASTFRDFAPTATLKDEKMVSNVSLSTLCERVTHKQLPAMAGTSSSMSVLN